MGQISHDYCTFEADLQGILAEDACPASCQTCGAGLLDLQNPPVGLTVFLVVAVLAPFVWRLVECAVILNYRSNLCCRPTTCRMLQQLWADAEDSNDRRERLSNSTEKWGKESIDGVVFPAVDSEDSDDESSALSTGKSRTSARVKLPAYVILQGGTEREHCEQIAKTAARKQGKSLLCFALNRLFAWYWMGPAVYVLLMMLWEKK